MAVNDGITLLGTHLANNDFVLPNIPEMLDLVAALQKAKDARDEFVGVVLNGVGLPAQTKDTMRSSRAEYQEGDLIYDYETLPRTTTSNGTILPDTPWQYSARVGDNLTNIYSGISHEAAAGYRDRFLGNNRVPLNRQEEVARDSLIRIGFNDKRILANETALENVPKGHPQELEFLERGIAVLEEIGTSPQTRIIQHMDDYVVNNPQGHLLTYNGTVFDNNQHLQLIARAGTEEQLARFQNVVADANRHIDPFERIRIATNANPQAMHAAYRKFFYKPGNERYRVMHPYSNRQEHIAAMQGIDTSLAHDAGMDTKALGQLVTSKDFQAYLSEADRVIDDIQSNYQTFTQGSTLYAKQGLWNQNNGILVLDENGKTWDAPMFHTRINPNAKHQMTAYSGNPIISGSAYKLVDSKVISDKEVIKALNKNANKLGLRGAGTYMQVSLQDTSGTGTKHIIGTPEQIRDVMGTNFIGLTNIGKDGNVQYEVQNINQVAQTLDINEPNVEQAFNKIMNRSNERQVTRNASDQLRNLTLKKADTIFRPLANFSNDPTKLVLAGRYIDSAISDSEYGTAIDALNHSQIKFNDKEIAYLDQIADGIKAVYNGRKPSVMGVINLINSTNTNDILEITERMKSLVGMTFENGKVDATTARRADAIFQNVLTQYNNRVRETAPTRIGTEFRITGSALSGISQYYDGDQTVFSINLDNPQAAQARLLRNFERYATSTRPNEPISDYRVRQGIVRLTKNIQDMHPELGRLLGRFNEMNESSVPYTRQDYARELIDTLTGIRFNQNPTEADKKFLANTFNDVVFAKPKTSLLMQQGGKYTPFATELFSSAESLFDNMKMTRASKTKALVNFMAGGLSQEDFIKGMSAMYSDSKFGYSVATNAWQTLNTVANNLVSNMGDTDIFISSNGVQLLGSSNRKLDITKYLPQVNFIEGQGFGFKVGSNVFAPSVSVMNQSGELVSGVDVLNSYIGMSTRFENVVKQQGITDSFDATASVLRGVSRASRTASYRTPGPIVPVDLSTPNALINGANKVNLMDARNNPERFIDMGIGLEEQFGTDNTSLNVLRKLRDKRDNDNPFKQIFFTPEENTVINNAINRWISQPGTVNRVLEQSRSAYGIIGIAGDEKAIAGELEPLIPSQEFSINLAETSKSDLNAGRFSIQSVTDPKVFVYEQFAPFSRGYINSLRQSSIMSPEGIQNVANSYSIDNTFNRDPNVIGSTGDMSRVTNARNVTLDTYDFNTTFHQRYLNEVNGYLKDSGIELTPNAQEHISRMMGMLGSTKEAAGIASAAYADVLSQSNSSISNKGFNLSSNKVYSEATYDQAVPYYYDQATGQFKMRNDFMASRFYRRGSIFNDIYSEYNGEQQQFILTEDKIGHTAIFKNGQEINISQLQDEFDNIKLSPNQQLTPQEQMRELERRGITFRRVFRNVSGKDPIKIFAAHDKHTLRTSGVSIGSVDQRLRNVIGANASIMTDRYYSYDTINNFIKAVDGDAQAIEFMKTLVNGRENPLTQEQRRSIVSQVSSRVTALAEKTKSDENRKRLNSIGEVLANDTGNLSDDQIKLLKKVGAFEGVDDGEDLLTRTRNEYKIESGLQAIRKEYGSAQAVSDAIFRERDVVAQIVAKVHGVDRIDMITETSDAVKRRNYAEILDRLISTKVLTGEETKEERIDKLNKVADVLNDVDGIALQDGNDFGEVFVDESTGQLKMRGRFVGFNKQDNFEYRDGSFVIKDNPSSMDHIAKKLQSAGLIDSYEDFNPVPLPGEVNNIQVAAYSNGYDLGKEAKPYAANQYEIAAATSISADRKGLEALDNLYGGQNPLIRAALTNTTGDGLYNFGQDLRNSGYYNTYWLKQDPNRSTQVLAKSADDFKSELERRTFGEITADGSMTSREYVELAAENNAQRAAAYENGMRVDENGRPVRDGFTDYRNDVRRDIRNNPNGALAQAYSDFSEVKDLAGMHIDDNGIAQGGKYRFTINGATDTIAIPTSRQTDSINSTATRLQQMYVNILDQQANGQNTAELEERFVATADKLREDIAKHAFSGSKQESGERYTAGLLNRRKTSEATTMAKATYLNSYTDDFENKIYLNGKTVREVREAGLATPAITGGTELFENLGFLDSTLTGEAREREIERLVRNGVTVQTGRFPNDYLGSIGISKMYLDPTLGGHDVQVNDEVATLMKLDNDGDHLQVSRMLENYSDEATVKARSLGVPIKSDDMLAMSIARNTRLLGSDYSDRMRNEAINQTRQVKLDEIVPDTASNSEDIAALTASTKAGENYSSFKNLEVLSNAVGTAEDITITGPTQSFKMSSSEFARSLYYMNESRLSAKNSDPHMSAIRDKRYSELTEMFQRMSHIGRETEEYNLSKVADIITKNEDGYSIVSELVAQQTKLTPAMSRIAQDFEANETLISQSGHSTLTEEVGAAIQRHFQDLSQQIKEKRITLRKISQSDYNPFEASTKQAYETLGKQRELANETIKQQEQIQASKQANEQLIRQDLERNERMSQKLAVKSESVIAKGKELFGLERIKSARAKGILAGALTLGSSIMLAGYGSQSPVPDIDNSAAQAMDQGSTNVRAVNPLSDQPANGGYMINVVTTTNEDPAAAISAMHAGASQIATTGGNATITTRVTSQYDDMTMNDVASYLGNIF